MKRGSLVSVGLVVLAAAVIPATASAQFVYVGGGANIPVGDFKDYAKTGWIAQAGLGYNDPERQRPLCRRGRLLRLEQAHRCRGRQDQYHRRDGHAGLYPSCPTRR